MIGIWLSMFGTVEAHASFTLMALMSSPYCLLKDDTLARATVKMEGVKRPDLVYSLEKRLDGDTDNTASNSLL